MVGSHMYSWEATFLQTFTVLISCSVSSGPKGSECMDYVVSKHPAGQGELERVVGG